MRPPLPLIAILGFLPLTACTGLEPAMLGTALTGAQTGISVLAGGEAWSFQEADFARVTQAVDDAGERLGLTRLNTTQRDGRYWVYFRYGDWSKLEVEVLHQTDRVTSITVVSRHKDHTPFATLYLERVVEALKDDPEERLNPPSAAAPAHQTAG